MLGNHGFVTTDPENIKTVLSKSKFREGELGVQTLGYSILAQADKTSDFVYGQRRDALLPFFGEGLFTQDGQPWKHSREMVRKQFARIQYNRLDVFTEHVEMLVSRLLRSKHTVVDLQPLFYDFTLDTTTSLLFGESAGSLQEDSRDVLGDSMKQASWISAIRIQLAYLYWLCSPPQYWTACRNVKQYADNWINKVIGMS